MSWKNERMTLKKEHYAYGGAIAAVAAGAGFMLFGITGARTVLGILLLFFLPSFLILSHFKLELQEKLFFSLFLGLGLFPLIAWYLGRAAGSLRLGALLAFLLLCGAGIALRFLKKRIPFEGWE